jgi:Putative Ig domain/Dockerin type I domain/Right handed beta helix region
MQRIILISLAVISLLSGVFAAIGSHPAPAQADTIPPYGCPATLDGNPIGGAAFGAYSGLVTEDYCDETVTTTDEFVSAVAKTGRKVWVEGAISLPLEVDMADDVLVASDLTGMLYNHDMTARNIPMLYAGARNHFLGVIIEGPDPEVGESNASPLTSGIGGYSQPGLVIESCEIRNWPSAGVIACGSDSQVIFNYIHHCRRLGRGYGVAVWGMNANVLIQGNRIEYSRHHVCGPERDDTDSFEVRYNIFGPSTHSQIDHHGGKDTGDLSDPAGKTLLIHHNTFTYAGQAPVTIRGIPADRCEIYNNWAYRTGDPYLIWRQELVYGSYDETDEYINMSQHDNWYGTAAPPSGNVAPVLKAVGNKSVKEGATLSFTVSAGDADGDALAYSASNLPSGATFNAASRTFLWTPSLSQAGVYSGVRFQVSDGQMTDYEDIAITVINEVAPVLGAIGNKSVNEGTKLSFTILGTDSNGDALTYSAANLPTGAALDPATRTFSWTPGFSQAGVYSDVRFQVSDGQMTDYEVITVTVANVLRPDVNDDGSINVLDMIMIGQHWSQTGVAGWIRQDINEDGVVNVLDATLIGQNWTG